MKTKDLILDVAAKEFAKVGFDALSMNNLVKKLDINKATIYYHFKDKRSLYNEVIKSEMTRGNNNIKAIFDQNKDPKELFKDYIEAIVFSIKQNPYIVSLALREKANFGVNVDESFIPHLDEETRYLEDIIKKLNLKEKYKSMDSYAVHSFIYGTIETFYTIKMSNLPLANDNELKLNSEKTLNYIAELLSNILLDAIVEK
ncbi:TetR/AcrR family transcriptional regulator [Halarcobacter sp.]|uniref:TetR/AcrR family transcriptional regulator n=1 Tax=Halarcobacter sp. TaxID=2321133 RepID=UPI0029F4E411|nr:TetR/AcrR family transcriptional regulator [Halarcobacter sp.]